MKCPMCCGDGWVMENTTCDACNGTGIVEPMTNEEWFASLPTEEKAKVFANATYSSAMMGAEITALPKEDEVRKWKMWLKAPHDWKLWLKGIHGGE